MKFLLTELKRATQLASPRKLINAKTQRSQDAKSDAFFAFISCMTRRVLQRSRVGLLLLLTLLLSTLQAVQEPPPEEPLFAGSLLSYYATNAAVGDVYVQPYLFATTLQGDYNDHWRFQSHKHSEQVQILNLLETGIIDQYLDISAVLNGFYGQCGNRHTLLYGDTQLYFGSQILKNQRNSWVPDMRIILMETFPTGSFQKLSAEKRGSDITGLGTYQTTIMLVGRKIFYTLLGTPSNMTFNLYYTLAPKTAVENLSVYGGGPGTRGVIKPGDFLNGNVGFEVLFTRNWGAGFDLHYQHQNKSSFSAKKNHLTAPAAGMPSSELVSFASCIEYNWSYELSVEAGVWLAVAGRNAGRFTSGIFTVFYAF